MIKLLASDLDGTILYNNKIVTKNLEAIRKIKQTNMKFVICTGKTYGMMKDICDELKPEYGIFCNGTQVINIKTGKEIIKNVITNKQALECLKVAQKHQLHIHIYTNNKIIVQENLKYMAYRNYILYKDKVKIEVVDSIERYIKEQKPVILKLIFSREKNLEKIKKEMELNENVTAIHIKKYGEYRDKIIGKEYEYLDIIPKDVTKYKTLKQLIQYLDILEEEVMTIGDNINDIEMIKNAKIGVAIGGCYEEIQKVASYVTQNTAQTGGFAEAIFKFLKEKRSKNVYIRRI